jgi:hypothetical protein
MAARLTLLVTVAFLGLVSSAYAEPEAAGANCRRFVPSAGVTVAVACTDVAALPETPLAKPAVQFLDAPGKVQIASKETELAAPAAAVPTPAPKIEKEEPMTTKVAAPRATQNLVEGTKAKRSSMKQCVQVLERAKAGTLQDGDVQLLREGCGRAS